MEARFTKTRDCTAYFTVPLSFTPSEVVAINIKMRGNYVSSSTSASDENFKEPGGTLMDYITFGTGESNIFTTTSSNKDFSWGRTKSSVSGNQLILEFQAYTGGSGSTNYSFQTRADKFYVEGTIIYK